jgi:mRNA interferase RelE/StbE
MLLFRVSKHAADFLEKLPKKKSEQILRKILALCNDPFPLDYKKLKGNQFYRSRIGEHRIVYEVHDNELYIFLIGKRNDDDVYRKLDRLT